MKTKCLASLFQHRAYLYRQQPFLGSKINNKWEWMNWEEACAWVEKAGRALISFGIQPEDKVAILSENRAEWALTDLAIQSIGAISVPIYSTSSTEQVHYILGHSEARAIFVSSLPSNPIFHKDIFSQLLSMDSVEKIISFDLISEYSAASKWLFLDQFLGLGESIIPKLFYDRIENIKNDSVSTIIYTSGTTGNPKGVMLTHNNIMYNCEVAAEKLSVSPQDLTLSFLPLSHAFERTGGLYGMIYNGVRIAYAESMGALAQNIQEITPTLLFCVPRVLEKIHSSIWEEVKKRPRFIQLLFEYSLKLSSMEPSRRTFFQNMLLGIFTKIFYVKVLNRLGGKIRFIISGGARLNPSIAQFFQQIGLPILQGYGLTETSPVVSVNFIHSNKIGSVGIPLRGVVVKIADDGEILVRGPIIMKGYYKDPKATAEAIDSEGCFHTGDIGYLDSEGYLFITDRKKELIVTSGGKKIPPQTLENHLAENPLIEQTCIIGEGQKFLSALIVPNFQRLKTWAEQNQISETSNERLVENEKIVNLYKKILEETNSKLASYETIKKFQLLPSEFSVQRDELTPTMKLKRKNIFNHYSKIIENIYSDALHENEN